MKRSQGWPLAAVVIAMGALGMAGHASAAAVPAVGQFGKPALAGGPNAGADLILVGRRGGHGFRGHGFRGHRFHGHRGFRRGGFRHRGWGHRRHHHRRWRHRRYYGAPFIGFSYGYGYSNSCYRRCRWNGGSRRYCRRRCW